MFEREKLIGGERRADGRAEAAVRGEILLERVVGERALMQPEPEAPSLLRPQNSRNVVWRWHVRRRQRDG